MSPSWLAAKAPRMMSAPMIWITCAMSHETRAPALKKSAGEVAAMGLGGIPWRGPGEGRPDLPLPPGPMPLWRDGALRKRWRYVGFYGESLMLCAARAEVGPAGQSFWVLWDRENGRELAHTA